MSRADISCENVILSKEESIGQVFTEKFIQVIHVLEQKKEVLETI